MKKRPDIFVAFALRVALEMKGGNGLKSFVSVSLERSSVMSKANMFRHHGRRGFYLIGILIALVIIMILAKNQLGSLNYGKDGETYIERTEGVACGMNRGTALSKLQMWRVNNPKERPSFQKIGVNVQCPEGGKWTFSRDGTAIYCSLHAPDPSITPVPTPTPIDSPF